MNDEISKYAAALGRKGGSVKSPRKAATSAANGAKGGAPTKAERAERIARYDALAEAGRKAPVERTPADLRTYSAVVRDLLAGHQVILCVQRYLAPADPDRAARGLETGLVQQERRWLEIDGRYCPSDRPTVDEVKAMLIAGPRA